MSTRRVEDLEAEARFRRERVELYRARSYARETSPAKLRKLERESAAAQERLDAARRQEAGG